MIRDYITILLKFLEWLDIVMRSTEDFLEERGISSFNRFNEREDHNNQSKSLKNGKSIE